MPLALEGTPQVSTTTSLPAFTTSLPAQIFVSGLINDSTGISSISGGGLTWTLRKLVNNGVPTFTEELWTAQANAALSGVTVTITPNGTPSFQSYVIFAFSGQDTGTIFDGNASVPAGNPGGAPADPVLISTNNANDVIIACFRMQGTANPTQGAGFTLISGANFQCSEYQIVSATQTNLSCGLGTGTGDSNGCVADALMAATGGPTPSSPVGGFIAPVPLW